MGFLTPSPEVGVNTATRNPLDCKGIRKNQIVGLYDYETMKKIVEMISVNLGGDTSFHGANFRNADAMNTDGTLRFQNRIETTGQSAGPMLNMNQAATRCTPMLPSAYAKTGPSIAGGKLGLPFKKQNARKLGSIAEMRRACQAGMFSFVDKLMACIAEHCTCCKSAGRLRCMLNFPPVTTGPEPLPSDQPTLKDLDAGNACRTPEPDKVAAGHLERDESMSAHSTVNRKRDTPASCGASPVSDKRRRVHVDQPPLDAHQDASGTQSTHQNVLKRAKSLMSTVASGV